MGIFRWSLFCQDIHIFIWLKIRSDVLILIKAAWILLYCSNISMYSCRYVLLGLTHWVWCFVVPQTVACQALCPWNFPGKNTGVGCRFLLQGIFPTQRWNLCLLCLLHWQADSLPLTPPGKPMYAYFPTFLHFLPVYLFTMMDLCFIMMSPRKRFPRYIENFLVLFFPFNSF